MFLLGLCLVATSLVRFAELCQVRSVNHGEITPKKGSYNPGDIVTIGCTPQYSHNSTNLTCRNDSSWDKPWPTCILEGCKKLESVTNGTITPNSTTISSPKIGTRVSFSCNHGYKLVGRDNITCLKTGTWSGYLPQCTKIRCKKIGKFDHHQGTVDPSTAMDKPTEVNGSISFSCNPGYKLNGSGSIRCLPSGAWNESVPRCIAVVCPNIAGKSKPHSYGYVNNKKLTVGTTFTQGCVGGYTCTDVGVTTRLCLNNGTWSGKFITCVKSCKTFPAISNRIVLYNTPYVNPVVGSTAVFQCSEGYTLNGTDTLECTKGGVWKPDHIPTCFLDLACDAEVLDLKNGKILPTSYHTDKISVGYTVTLSCDHGFYLNDTDKTVICGGNSKWNKNILPKCLSLGNVDAQIKSLKISGIYIGVGVIIVFILLVIFFSFADSRYEKRRMRHKISTVSVRALPKYSRSGLLARPIRQSANEYTHHVLPNGRRSGVHSQGYIARRSGVHSQGYNNPGFISHDDTSNVS